MAIPFSTESARAPLQPTRLLPTPSSSPVKRVSIHSPKLSSSSAPRKAMQPPSFASSPATSTPAPKRHAAVPYLRLMTPSSSTVAASSSPPRNFMSSSPVAPKTAPKAVGPPLRIEVTADRTIVLGRHKTRLPTTSTTPVASNVSLAATIPSHIALLQHPDRPVDIVALPRTASHASRVHAVVEFDAASDSLRIAVIGQNGVRVKGGDRRKSRRVKRGDSVDVPRGEVQVDFYGCLVQLSFPPVPARSSATPHAAGAVVEEKAELPPSSPPMQIDEEVEGEEMDVEMTMDEPAPAHAPAAVNAAEVDIDAASSGLSAAEEEKEVKEELLDGALSTSLPTPVPAATPTPVPVAEDAPEHVKAKSASRETTPLPDDAPLPDGVDLAAILASTVVFSGSSKMSLPDMVKHMLESQPSLKAHGGESRWTRWVHEELNDNPMFGKVERHGKDASGKALLPHFFYNPEHDPDAGRARELSGLVRPLRAAQRSGGKALDWRPVGGGRRRY